MESAQRTRWNLGVLNFPAEVIISTTRATESEDVIIKLQIKVTPSTLSNMDKGNFSKNTYIAVEISSFTAFIIAVSPNKISFILIPPKAENHKKVTAAGSRSTPNINRSEERRVGK